MKNEIPRIPRTFEAKKLSIDEAEKTLLDMHIIQLSRPEIPVIKEERNKPWVSYGEKNDYPQQLIKYLDTSAIHSAIVTTKAKMVTGNDILFNGINFNDFTKDLDPKSYEYLKMFYKDPSGTGITLNELSYNLAYDFQVQGQLALEIIWSLDFSRIARIKHVDVSRIRAGKLDENGEVCSYYYSKDWSETEKYPTKCPPREIARFDRENREDYRQLLFVFNYHPGQDYYGRPSYASALSWINIDAKLGEFHLSNIDNGFAPSMSIKFYKKPGSPDEKYNVVREIDKQFKGARNAGKAMVFFSDGKDLAPDINAIENSKVDEMLLILGEDTVQNILSGHRVTSPALLGIAIPGKLGYSNELVTSYALFNKNVITPDQNILERTLQIIADINGFGCQLSIESLIKVDDLINPKSKPQDFPLPIVPDATIAASNEVTMPRVINENIKNLTAKQHQQLLRILRQYSKEQITEGVATTLLRTGLGLSDEEIQVILSDNEPADLNNNQ